MIVIRVMRRLPGHNSHHTNMSGRISIADGRFPGMGRVYKEQEFAVLWTDPRLEKIVKR